MNLLIIFVNFEDQRDAKLINSEAPRYVLENSIRDLSYLRIVCTAYDLIAAHGKTSGRIDETKRSGGTRMVTDKRSERGRGGNGRDGAVGGKGARGFEAG